MIIKANHQLDLLKRRRESSNSKKLTYSQLKQLRRRGYLYGILISLLGLSIIAWTSIQTFRKIKYKEKLAIEAKEYELLKTKYNSITKDLKYIYKINTQIAQGILGTHSGSALLLELKEKIPTTIQLSTIKSNGRELTLQGKANQPHALSSINSLEIQLSDSFLIQDKSVFLSQASEAQNNQTSYLNFTLKSRYSIPNSESLLANYERLGSFGLFRRASLLKQEGLIK